MNIRKATIDDTDKVTELALLLWHDNSYDELFIKMKKMLKKNSQIIFLAFESENHIGFAHCSLRYDYVEGTDGGGNVGYLEGIYVRDECRKSGVARSLVKCCENWAKRNGCIEFASDCDLDNTNSYNFHLKIGFIEANRIICFAKKFD
jgi:aminoglycoside 6'-N-acetyltransferase I